MIRFISKLSISLLCFAMMFTAQADQENLSASRWQDIKQAVFKQALVTENDKVIQLDAPQRAYDAAIVPIKINVSVGNEQFIDKLFLIVDNNPAPLAGTFAFNKHSSKIEIQTRIRIDQYTNVRAIAKTNDNQYFMNTVYVKAAGGCSAPMMSDQEAALARVGNLKFKIGQSEQLPQSRIGHVLISHPNNSGMQFDQVSRNFIPAYFVNKISVKLDNEELFVLDTNFSLSENPSIHFSFDSENGADAKISVQAVDTRNDKFEKTWSVGG